MTLRFDPAAGGWIFETPSGSRVLKDPNGLPTGRQLIALAGRGLLEIHDTPGPRPTKLEAARAIDRAGGPERPRVRTQGQIRADLLAAVQDDPGQLWSTIRARVAGRHSSKRDALDHLIIAGHVRMTRGKGGGMLLWPGRTS